MTNEKEGKKEMKNERSKQERRYEESEIKEGRETKDEGEAETIGII
jgi:hypothetical protein